MNGDSATTSREPCMHACSLEGGLSGSASSVHSHNVLWTLSMLLTASPILQMPQVFLGSPLFSQASFWFTLRKELPRVMEVIGAVSSIVTLVETTSKLAKSLTHLVQRWHNAPEEILALAHATGDLATKFAFVESTITNSPSTLIDDIPRQGLMELVLKAKTVTNELDILQKKLNTYRTVLQRAKWAVKDARTVKSALATIKDIEEGLSMWINFVSLYVPLLCHVVE
jgi:hypothetical protein